MQHAKWTTRQAPLAERTFVLIEEVLASHFGSPRVPMQAVPLFSEHPRGIGIESMR